jgi:hypothetical protein
MPPVGVQYPGVLFSRIKSPPQAVTI